MILDEKRSIAIAYEMSKSGDERSTPQLSSIPLGTPSRQISPPRMSLPLGAV